MKWMKLLSITLLASLFLMACQKDDIAIPDTLEEPIELRSNLADYIPLAGFQPEGIVMGKGNTAYVGGIVLGTILKVDLKTGEYAPLTTSIPGDLTIGLTYDPRSDLIYAGGGMTGKVKVYNVHSGELVQEFQVTAPGTPQTTWVNDLIVTKKAVFVTNSLLAELYKIPLGPAGQLPGADDFEVVPLSGDWVQETVPLPGQSTPYCANGIDATPNGKTLVLVNSTNGLVYRVDANTGVCQLIPLDHPLFMPDGIVLKPKPGNDGYFLWVAQNVNVVSKVSLDQWMTSGEIIDNIFSPYFMNPTTLDLKGEELFVVNGRFAEYFPNTLYPMVEFSVVKVPK